MIPVEVFEKILSIQEFDEVIHRDYNEVINDERFRELITTNFDVNYEDFIKIVDNYYKKIQEYGKSYTWFGYDDLIYSIFKALGFDVYKTGRGTIVVEENPELQEIVLYVFGDPDLGIVSYDVVRVKGYRFGTSYIIHNDDVVWGSPYIGYPLEVRPVELYAIDVIKNKLQMSYTLHKIDHKTYEKYVNILMELECIIDKLKSE